MDTARIALPRRVFVTNRSTIKKISAAEMITRKVSILIFTLPIVKRKNLLSRRGVGTGADLVSMRTASEIMIEVPIAEIRLARRFVPFERRRR